MIKKSVLIFIFGAFAAQAALAQEVSGVAANIRPRVPEAPSNAIEFGLGGGYAQGVGDIGGSSPTLTELTHGGGEIQLNIGYRWNPNWLFGIYGTGGKYNTGNNTPDGSDAYSATAGVQANYHILPGQQWDPWVGLGVGWRGHWISKPNGTDSRHGMDIARLQVGVDYKVSPEFAISPFVGASATMFFTQSVAGQAGGFSNINDPNVNFFFTGGVMGRFDVMGIAG